MLTHIRFNNETKAAVFSMIDRGATFSEPTSVEFAEISVENGQFYTNFKGDYIEFLS